MSATVKTLRLGNKSTPIRGRELARPPVGQLSKRPTRVQLGLVLLPLQRPLRADAVPVPRPTLPATALAAPKRNVHAASRPPDRPHPLPGAPRTKSPCRRRPPLATRLGRCFRAPALGLSQKPAIATARPARPKHNRPDLLGRRHTRHRQPPRHLLCRRVSLPLKQPGGTSQPHPRRNEALPAPAGAERERARNNFGNAQTGFDAVRLRTKWGAKTRSDAPTISSPARSLPS